MPDITQYVYEYNPVSDIIIRKSALLPLAGTKTSAAYHPGTNKIYIFGGLGGSGYFQYASFLDQILEYDPVADTITAKSAKLPTPRWATAAVYYSTTNKIYVIGGSSATGTALDEIVEYDPVADTATIKTARLPTPRSDVSAACAPETNKIYVFGGVKSRAYYDTAAATDILSDVVEYDPAADTDTVKASLTQPRWRTSSAYHPATGKIYIIGGQRGTTVNDAVVLNSVEEYDPAANTIAARPVILPKGRTGSAAAYHSGTARIYIFGDQGVFPNGYPFPLLDGSIVEYKFNMLGTYKSAVMDAGNRSNLASVYWNPASQFSSSVTLAVGLRAGSVAAPDSSWSNAGNFVSVTNGGDISGFGPNRYVQYIATFTTTDISTTPVLDDIAIGYNQTPPGATAVSSAFDSGSPLNVIQKIAWQGAFPAGTSAQFQIRTASDNGSGFPASWSAWTGPTSSADYYADPAGGQPVNPAHRDAVNDRWFQYKAFLISSGTFSAATISTVTVTYNFLPDAPSLVSLSAGGSTQITATLADNSANEDEFVISSGTASGPVNMGVAAATADKGGSGGIRSVAIGGLSPDIRYYVRVRARILPPDDLFSFYSNERNIATQANAPASFSISAVYISSAALYWDRNGNPGTTPYEISISTDNFAVNHSTPVAFSSNLTANTAAIEGLAPGTTCYFRIRARNLDGAATGFGGVVSTQTLPGTLGPPSGTALGVSSISWTWANTAGPAVRSYDVYRASGGGLLGNVSAPAFSDTGLSTNTAYGIRVVPVNESGPGALSPAATIYTLAAPPSAPAVTAHISSITVNWSSNRNPAWTVFEIRRSTDNAAFAPAASLFNPAFNDTEVSAGNTYYYRIRAVNGDGISSEFAGAGGIFMVGDEPLPPGDFTAMNSNGGVIRLDWRHSPTPGVPRYNIYWDAGNGSIGYAVKLSSVPGSANSYVTPALPPGTYYFGLRAQNAVLEEKNTGIAASATIPDYIPADWVQARVRAPASGKKIWGNRVTVLAELIRGDRNYARQAEFQYRVSGATGSAWAQMPASEFNNPDVKSPYYVHWNVSGLPAGDYEIRAVATNYSGEPDPAPPTKIITINSSDPDIEETLQGASLLRREQVYNAVVSTVNFGDLSGEQINQVIFPNGALGIYSRAVLKILSPPTIASKLQKELSSTGIFHEITLENGQTQLNAPVTLTASYQDDDDDGLLDGTLARTDRLTFMVYNTASGLWEKETPSSIDTVNKTVTVQTSHFSTFGLFASAAPNLDKVRAYPVPFVPNDGVEDNGKPYNKADPGSGIIFDNLTQSSRVEIFSISGELIWEKTTDNSSGKIQWDAKNSNGWNVASGGYIAVIRDTATGQKVVKKIAIIR